MVSYKLKSKVEDFLVNEVSLWPDLCPREFSQFTYIRVKKVGMTTFEALDKIRQFFRLGYSDVSKQGLKDEDAITYQLIAVKSILLAEDISRFNRKFAVSCPLLKIVDLFGYGKEPLKSRLLHGNVFKVTIRNLDKSAVNLLYNFCFKNRFFTFINYYDSQRFGVAGGHYNTHLIGKAIVENDW
ncbi:tRNA pseudouridine(13) synthase TruD, partial [Patescibacteria group bacterium]|nr:tRNA pseudouridine(13) synthase TruD [Patescibacteria group bacterium]